MLFVATFDLASQGMARTLNDLARFHRPRINVLAVTLEAPKYAMFAETFRSSLGLSYPVAIADQKTRSGRGAFGATVAVPTLVVLDQQGRPVFSQAGAVAKEKIREVLIEARKPH